LAHPNIVTIYDVGEADGYPYIAMELLEGAALDDPAVTPGELGPQRVLEIGLQLARALAYAHAAGVVHRDIKPSNILLGPDRRAVKILDFGIARMTDPGAGGHDAETLATQVGEVIGTPRYMSPEQALGQVTDGRSDLFSVGAVLYELITGAKAFSAASPLTLALQITQGNPAPISNFAPDCPRGLAFIIGKLLAKRPDRRFRDGEQLAEALRKELAAFSDATGEARAAAWRMPLQARLMLIMALATAVALLFATGAVLDRQYVAMRQMALTSGSAIAAFVANNAGQSAAENAALPAEQRDWLPLQAFVKVASADPNVRSMAVVDADGVIEAASDPALLGRRYRAPVAGVVERGVAGLVAFQTVDGRDHAFRFVRPITYAGRTFGKVDINLDASALAAAAQLSRLLLLALAAATLGVVMMSSYAAARMFALPIRRLKAAMAEVSAGNLEFRISHRRRDEFGELFDAFNRLTGQVQGALERGRARPKEPAPAPPSQVPLRPATPAAPPDFADATRLAPAAAQTQPWRARWARVAGGASAAATVAERA
jgi:serine/threonine-protein kinase